MNKSMNNQINSYNNTQKDAESTREIEARALLNCAAKMHKAQQEEENFELYIEAIKSNQKLWTIFQVSLCEPNNPLPRDLKITLLNLSRFVDKVSLRAMAEYNTSLLTSLIDINRNIAAGLNVKQEHSQLSSMPAASTQASTFTASV